MPPHELIGFTKFWSEYGIIAAFIMLFAAVGLIFFGLKIRTLIIQTEEATTLIRELFKAHANSKGEPIRMHEHHTNTRDLLIEIKTLLQSYQQYADDHYEDVKRLSNEEKWHNCPIDKCPNFPKILISYQDLIAKFEIFQVHAVESRDRMAESMERMADELSSLGREIIAALRIQIQTEKDNAKASVL